MNEKELEGFVSEDELDAVAGGIDSEVMVCDDPGPRFLKPAKHPDYIDRDGEKKVETNVDAW